MRRPRIRFTVGTLLVVVAVVAADCWAIRWLTGSPVFVCGSVSYRPLPAGIGALPLLDAAAIGLWSCATRRLRRRRRADGSPASSPSPWPGATFFSVHFLALGLVLVAFSPDAARLGGDLLDVGTELAAMAWQAVVGEAGETIPWFIADSTVLGLLLSGPPLLLAWIGGMLAVRSARAMPRFRFRVLGGLVSLGFATAALAIALTPQPFAEEQDVDIEVHVVDRTSSRPIGAAFVCLTDPFAYDPTGHPPRALTDAGGHARMTGRFDAGGHRNAFRAMGTFSPWGRWLLVSAAGHRTRRIPLTEVLGPAADLGRPCRARVALDAGATPADTLRDLTGWYGQGGGFGGSSLRIEPDGRFAWEAVGCTFRTREYGYVRRHGEQIELIPVPHPGEEIHPVMFETFREVRWGERVYLSMARPSELRRFCREALAPRRPEKSGPWIWPHGWRYLRGSDRDRPRTGLPRLPAEVWAGFLAVEMDLGNEDGYLRRGLETLLSRLLDGLRGSDLTETSPSRAGERPAEVPGRSAPASLT